MRTQRCRGRAIARLAIALATTLSCPVVVVPSYAEDRPQPSPPGVSMSAALVATRTKGVPTIVIVTSGEQPESDRLAGEFCDGAWARSNRGLVQIVNVSKDRDPALVRAMDVSTFPTVVVYARGPKGLTQVKTMTDCDSAEVLANRLETLDFGLESAGLSDPSLKPVAFAGEVHPSQQFHSQAEAPPSPAPSSVPPASALALMPAPPVPAMASMSAGLIQVPSQNLVIQQAPPQVFLSPTQAPMVYMPQMVASAPAPAAMAAVPAANLFMPSPSPSAAPMPMPTASYAVAPTPVAAPPVPVMAVAAAAPTAVAAVTNQTVSLPNARSSTRVRVRGPGLLGSSLSRMGERLVQLGRARIETIQSTTIDVPSAPTVGSGMSTISTTSTAPISQPPTAAFVPVTVAVPAPQSRPQVIESMLPVMPMPSPQESPRKFHWPFH